MHPRNALFFPSKAKILIPRHEQKTTPQVGTCDVTGLDLVRNWCQTLAGLKAPRGLVCLVGLGPRGSDFKEARLMSFPGEPQ